MFRILLIPALITAVSSITTFSLADGQDTDLLRKSVINFKCKLERRDPTRPWLPYPGIDISGSGVVIAPGKILTNAHVVHQAKEVLLETDQTALPISGKVIAIDLGRDLALVEVTDQEFIDAHPPVQLMDGLPADGSDIIVMGYPMGGETLSTTTGVISRCEWEQSGSAMEDGMRVQVDAAINPGNSGGPGFVNNQIAGISVSGPAKSTADNIAYMIATEEIQRFLREAEADSIDGNSILNINYQDLKNPAIRKKLGIDSSVTGVVVIDEESELLKPWDIITSVNGYEIENDGQITIEDNRKVSMGASIGRFDPLIHGETVEVIVLRDGESITIQHPAISARESVIQNIPNGKYPYIVVGPLVFGPMHRELVNAHMRGSSSYMYYYGGGPFIKKVMDMTPAEGEEIVTLLSTMLSHPVGRGYDTFAGQTVKSVNNKEFNNFAEFVEIIASLDEEWIVFKFNENAAPLLVFDKQELYDSTSEIMESNGIRRAASKEFRGLWSVDD